MRKRAVIWFLSIVSQTILLAQPKVDPESIFDDAVFFYTIEDYKEASFLFQQLLRDNPENANFNFYAGMSLLNIKGQEKKAINFFERAVMFTSLKYKQRSYTERKAPHHAWFYLGNAYRINNELDKALDAYEKFQNIKDFERHFNTRIVEDEIKACNRAKIIQDSPLRIRKENPGSPINTAYSDYNAVLSADEKVIVYISSQRFYEAVMYSRKSDKVWSNPVNITSQIGSDGDMYPCFITKDGSALYLVKKTRSGGDIYISRLEGEFWSTAQPLGTNINTRSNESHASLSPDENSLLFTSDMKGGAGGLDIYVSEKRPDGEWGLPVNIGTSINTALDEDTPFFSPDGNTIYFSSTGHFNMGGYDIFFTSKNPEGNWSDPINIGYPVNTTGDDKFFFPVENNHVGYMSEYDEENSVGMEDIFKIRVLPYSALTEIKERNFDRDFSLEINDKETGEIMEINYESISDKFLIRTNRPGKKYIIKIKDQ